MGTLQQALLLVGLCFLLLVALRILYELVSSNAIRKWQLENNRIVSQLKEENGRLTVQLAIATTTYTKKEKENAELSNDNKTLMQRVTLLEATEPPKRFRGNAINVARNHRERASRKITIAHAQQKAASKSGSGASDQSHKPSQPPEIAKQESTPQTAPEQVARQPETTKVAALEQEKSSPPKEKQKWPPYLSAETTPPDRR